MLTKDLLRYKCLAKNIKPQFIDENNDLLLGFCQNILRIYQQKIITRCQLNEQVNYLTNNFSDIKLAKGLNKLCLDRTIFTPSISLKKERQEIFETSFQLLERKNYNSYQQFKDILTQKLKQQKINNLYADLSDNDKIEQFNDIRPSQLLQRYNISLIQSLLLHSTKIIVKIEKVKVPQLRNFFKYLRFFRLLFQVKKIKSQYIIELDGAQSVFEQTKKYGLQLANFFPALVNLDSWEMQAQLELKRNLILKISNKLNLVSHYNHFGDYIPEEIKLFEQIFKKQKSLWKISSKLYLYKKGQQIFIPDFSFIHKKLKKQFHLELFHRWHKFQLLERLENYQQGNFIFAIERKLLKNKAIKKIVEKDCWQDKILLYSDFPSAKKLISKLA